MPFGSDFELAGSPKLRFRKRGILSWLPLFTFPFSLFARIPDDQLSLHPSKTGLSASMILPRLVQCSSLGDFRMTSAPKPVGGPLHSADAPFPDKAKKRPWPPRRLIATLANSEIAPTPSKHRPSPFLIATKNT